MSAVARIGRIYCICGGDELCEKCAQEEVDGGGSDSLDHCGYARGEVDFPEGVKYDFEKDRLR